MSFENPECIPPRVRARRATLAVLAIATSLSGCRAPERITVATERTISDVARLEEVLEFRVVGEDGVPIDEPAPVGGALSLAEAVRLAVTTAPDLQAALARVRLAAAEADQARLLPNPVLGVVFRAGEGRPQIEASFAQEFVRALVRPRAASAADNRLRAASADAVVTALDTIREVQEDYASAQSWAALLPLLEERLELVGRPASTARARLDAGEGTRGDVVTLDAQRVQLEVTIDLARLEERASRIGLARRIGRPSSEATWDLEPWSSTPFESLSEDAWTEAALGARPEIQAIVWRLAALGDEAALVSSLPWQGAGAGLEAQKSDGWQAGPSLSTPLPVFDDGSARRARNDAERLEARHELTSVQRRVVEEVRVAYRSLLASRANLTRIRTELIPLQVERRRLAEDAYRAGVTDVTQLFLAEQDLRIAQTQAIEIALRAELSLVRLQRAVGGPAVVERTARVPARAEGVLAATNDVALSAGSVR